MRGATVVVAVLSLGLHASAIFATTWHVLPDGSGNAPTIQAGLASAVSGDTVLVAPGTYTEPMINTGTYGNAMLVMKSGVVLLSEGGRDVTTLNAQGQGRVIYCQGVSSSTQIIGFTIRNGDADGYRRIGAGILCYSNSRPLIADNRIFNNTGHSGGGIASYASSYPVIRGNIIEGNSVPNGNGGGILCYQGGSTTIEDNVFRSNSAVYGGGVFVYVGSAAVIRNNLFEENSGGASAALQTNLSQAEVTGNVFVGNFSEGTVVQITESSNVTMESNVFYGNEAIRVVNRTGSATLSFSNNIISENSGIGLEHESGGGLTLGCNDLWSNTGGDFVGVSPGPGDFFSDPLFCNADAGDFTLRSDSPCLPGNHPYGYSCGVVGPFGEGCTAVPPDTIPPAPVTQFSATCGDESARLTWKNPSTSDFHGVYIAYSTSTYPNDHSDGSPVENGNNGLVPGVPGARDTLVLSDFVNGVTYYFSAFAYDGASNYSQKSTTWATPMDVTPPSPLVSFDGLAGDTTAQLSWTNPMTTDFAGTTIRYSSTSYPTTPAHGSPVPNGNDGRFTGTPGSGASFTHSGIRNGTTYFYSAFAYDEVPNYSSAAHASVIPTDAAPPGPVVAFVAQRGNEQIALSWTNPLDRDFIGTVVRFSTTLYPSTPTAGWPVPNGGNGRFPGSPGAAGIFTHTGLSNGTTYYYAAFAYDEVPNYSLASNAQGTPDDVVPPGPVTGLVAWSGDGEALLSWTNPSSADFSTTTVRYATTDFPSWPSDGIPVENGSGGVFSGTPGSVGSFTHAGLTNGTTYYYSAFASDASNNYASAAQASATPADTLAPAAVTQFQVAAGDTQIGLTWKNPSDADFAGTVVRFSTTSMPTGPAKGKPVPNGNDGRFAAAPGSNGSYTHTGLANETAHYYAAFAYDEVPNYASGASGNATPQDMTAPAAPASFTAAAGEGEVTLRWNHPADSDLVGTLIRFATTNMPSGPPAGSPLPNGNDGRFLALPAEADSFTHTGLTNGSTYYYAAFAYDEVPNYSPAATASALPQDVVPPMLTLGILQHPYFTQNLDLYMVASEPLDPTSVSMTVGGVPRTLQLNDADENVWKGDYSISGGGVLSLAASAEDMAGNPGSASGSFSAKLFLAGKGGSITSPDGAMELRVGPDVLGGDTYLLVIPGRLTAGAGKAAPAADDASSYEVFPRGALRGRGAEIVFHYLSANVPTSEPERLYVQSDESSEALPSFVDPSAGTVSAGITDLGKFSLQVGRPGSSVPTDPTYALLEQNRPNPFNPTTTIRFEIRAAQHVRLDVFGISGTRIRTLVDSYLPPGTHTATWEGTGESGGAAPSGVYFYRLRTEQAVDTKKMLLLR